ncbi:Protein mahjong, partial [Pseudolycoriella hygida]
MINGVLWEVRSGEEVHRFNMSNQTFSGVFHPNGLEIVSDDKVWDMRTFGLLRTVPELHQSTVTFSSQNVIYGVECETKRLAPRNYMRRCRECLRYYTNNYEETDDENMDAHGDADQQSDNDAASDDDVEGDFKEEEYLEFGKLNEDKILGTCDR